MWALWLRITAVGLLFFTNIKISSIKKEEVKEEVGKILDLYSALNSKINTIYKAEEVQKSIEVDTEKPINLEEQQEISIYRKINRTRERRMIDR